ncbi:hypothetical protein J6590_043258 [Homalodisca vitripennis]|nr:hypothetical protein J6590_043258 [Homalodisca vitripennis]
MEERVRQHAWQTWSSETHDTEHPGNESIRVPVPTPCLGGRGSRIAGPHDSAHTP